MPSRDPVISVIIPVYNAESYLPFCVESVLRQDVNDIEIFLLDDCSTDHSYDICKQIASNDKRVTTLRNPSNIGQGLTRNKGIAHSRGRYITFVDSDDYIAPDMYSSMLTLAADTHADIVRCAFERVDEHSEKYLNAAGMDATVLLSGERFRRYCDGYYGMLPSESLDDAPSMSPCTALYPGELIRRNNVVFPSERIIRSEDLFFNLRVCGLANSEVISSKAYYKYYTRRGSTSHRYTSPVSKCLLLRNIAPNGDEYRLRLTRTFLTSVKEACLQLAASKASLFEGAATVRALEQELDLRSLLGNYPIHELPLRERLFSMCACMQTGIPEMVLAKLDIARKAK